MKILTLSFSLLFSLAFSSQAQFIVTPDSNAVQVVNDFILSGVTATNVVYTGANNSLGTFNNGGITNLGMTDGLAMTTGTFGPDGVGIGSPVSMFASYMNGTAGDSLLNTLVSGSQTYDASVLEFDLVPAGNVLEFQYVFASEEYPEFVASAFNDIFGFFIDGPNPSGGNYVAENIAQIPSGGGVVSINNVNAVQNSSFFVDNQSLGGISIVFDGFTTVLVAQVYVSASSNYHLKMVVSDVSDGIYDSGIFMKAQSMKSYIYTGIKETIKTTSTIYPNPVNNESVLNIQLGQPGKVEVTLSDYCGRKLSIIENTYILAGNYSIAIGQMTNGFPAGIYFIGIQTPEMYYCQKVIVD